MTKPYTDINVTADGHVTVVEIQRPPHNFFDRALIMQIADAFESADADPTCRCLLLAAAGKNFCAGADFSGATAASNESTEFTEAGFNASVGDLYREALRLFRNRKPVVGAIQGAAIGGGFGVALVPDFRVVCPETRFAANFVKLGIHQGFGLSVTLPRLVGTQTANLLLLTGRRVTGEDAVAMGLAEVITTQDSVRDEAMRLAQEIAANAPLAVQSVRATLRAGLAAEIAAATERELGEQQRLRATADAEEGIRAVAARRPGHFQGC